MKVLQVGGEYYDAVGRGIGGYVYHLSKYLIREGYEVDVVAYIRGRIRGSLPGVKVYNIPLSQIPLWRMSRWGFEAYEKVSRIAKNYDIIHAHMPSCFGYPALYKIGKPLIITAHTTCLDPSCPEWLRPYYFMADKLSYKQADHIMTVSKAVTDELVKIGISSQMTTITPVGVDLERFYPSKVDREFEFLKIRNDNSLVLLYVGTVSKRKGAQYLLDALHHLPEDVRKNVYVIIAGTGPLLSSLREKYSNFKNIKFCGYVDDKLLPLLYNSADVFVYPSLYEGLPTVILEAMASGLPVIATDIPSIAEVVKPDFGILVKPMCPTEIAQSIVLLARNPRSRREMAKNASLCSKKYSWRQAALQVSTVYERIASMYAKSSD